MNMVQLRALAKGHNLRGYSRLRKADLINFINESIPEDEPPKDESRTHHEPREQPQKDDENTKLSKRQRKRMAQKASKLSKKSKNLRIEINDLKSQKDDIEDKINKASRSASSRFKQKKIHSMKREATKINERMQERTKELKTIEVNPIVRTSQQSKENKRIKKKIEDLNRKIRRVKGANKAKNRLMAKREALKLQLNDTTPRLIEGAFGGNYSKYRIDGIEGMDLPTFFSKIRGSISNVLKKETTQRSIRSQTTTRIKFMKGDEYVSLAFNSRMTPVYMLNDIDSIVQSMINHMAQQVENPALRDSKFVFDSIMHTDISIHRQNLMRGSSYIPLPDWLAKKKAILNPKNLDMKCFKWAVIAGLKWEEIDRDHQRVSKLRRYENEFDWEGMSYPVSTKDINKFETRNRIGVNVLALDGRNPYICRKGLDYERTVNLMILEDGEKKHYVAIKSLERLLSMNNSKHKESQHFCNNCLQGFKTQESRDNHYDYCRSNESVRIEMPTRNPIVSYSNGQHQFKVPFVMYADFESILEPIQGVSNDPAQSSTRGVNIHKPSGWCLHSKFAYGKVKKPTMQYRGPDCVEKFCEKIISEAKRLYKSFPEVSMLPLTKVQKKEYNKATKCHICFREFKDKGKVRDHCHYTGVYRGAAHFGCNLRYKIPSYIPVVFHNLAGYDVHLFIRELAKHTKDMGVIATNVEDYISFSIKVEVDKYVDKNGEEKYKEFELRFINSFKFMSSSLDSLVHNLAKGDHKFWGFEEYNYKQRELLIRKGIYPYEYMNSWDRFNDDRLPRKEHFYSNLNMSGVSDKEYQHACKVWKEFKIKNMGEYHDLYLRTDVILLSNVFESFRNVCMDNYGLDPAHFYTAPGLAWKACLKKTGIRLELLQDPDMLLMFERGIRGGITQSVHRYAAANNPYMEEYDKNKETNYLQYLDANNLYGWEMSQPLPTGEFRWINCGNWNPKRLVDMLSAEKNHGYLLEADVNYPKDLHDLHNDIPFMCSKMKVNGVEKLIPNLYDKRKYIIQ